MFVAEPTMVPGMVSTSSLALRRPAHDLKLHGFGCLRVLWMRLEELRYKVAKLGPCNAGVDQIWAENCLAPSLTSLWSPPSPPQPPWTRLIRGSPDAPWHGAPAWLCSARFQARAGEILIFE